ncbi:MAG: response regulator [Pseudomonadota bacterium]
MQASRPILVVDDDSDIREALCQVLQDEGHHVVAAANGKEAFDHLRSSLRPRLILLDLMMPIMNGWEFRTEQLRDEALASIPVVIISADREARKKAVSIGAAGFLQKPIQLESLLSIIEKYP